LVEGNDRLVSPIDEEITSESQEASIKDAGLVVKIGELPNKKIGNFDEKIVTWTLTLIHLMGMVLSQ